MLKATDESGANSGKFSGFSRIYLTNKEAPTVLCSVVKHAGSG